MDSRCGLGKVVRMRVEDDRISSLSDDLIHKILSFVGLKHVVQTSALSSRWRYIWTSLPYLNFSSNEFTTLPKFANFVKHFISGRNNLLEVSSVELNFRGKVSQLFVRRIMDYAFTHNAQLLNVRILDCRAHDLPVSLFSSQSLKTLSLYRLKPALTWDLPSLTTLYLDDVIFYGDEGIGHISKCANLKNLTLHRCRLERSYDVTVGFDIHLPQLSNLRLEDAILLKIRLNVFAPKLENLTVIHWEEVHLQFSPKLVSLVFKGSCSGLLQISSLDLCLLEKVDLCIYKPFRENEKIDHHNFVALLHQIQNAKYITLNLELIQLIFSFGELILHQPSPFANLKHLKVYPHNPFSAEQQTMPTEVKNYFLDSSPCATFTMVSYEEMKALQNVASAYKLMAEFQMLLEQEKINCETNIDRSKAPIECERMLIRKCWKDLFEQIEQGKTKINVIFSKLAQTESSMNDLPASKKEKIHARFSSLREEAYNVMKLVMDCMKINCDAKQGCISDCLHQVFTTSQLFS